MIRTTLIAFATILLNICCDNVTGTSKYHYNISVLFIPSQQKSFLMEHVILMKELISQGNSVSVILGSKFYPTVMKTLPPEVKVYTFSQSPNRVYGHTLNQYLAEFLNNNERLDAPMQKYNDPKFAQIMDITPNDCQDMWMDEMFITSLRNSNFDVAYVDVVLHYLNCFSLVPYNLSVPVVTHLLRYVPWVVRIPASPAFVPIFSDTDNMSLYEKATNLLKYFMMDYISPSKAKDPSLLRAYAPGIHDWDELLRQSDLFIFAMADPTIRLPSMPNVILSQRIMPSTIGDIPNHLNTLIDDSGEGIILVSFGSIFNGISPRLCMYKMLEAFSQIPEYTVIYSYSGEINNLNSSLPSNVHLMPWVPQNDILRHKKTKLFVTHGGGRGLQEAMYHGVPMLVLKFTFETNIHALKVTKKGFGRDLDFYTFTSEDMLAEMKEILANPVYHQNIQKISAIMKHAKPQAKDLVLYWIEHIARFVGVI